MANQHERDERQQANPLMTVAEAADCLRFHPSTVYRLVRGGHLPALKLGKQWRVSKDAIHRLAESGQIQPGNHTPLRGA
ncbi:MAG TPA: helix-turn-helix domain-containing protein [Dehalococcoidia bacterium]|jgi:excisionase family DNA binding protein|nr:helix-turn-helix domain-containing protein [Dehalococcoidia bacterium]